MLHGASGPLAVEELLLAAVDQRAGRADSAGLLAAPLRIVVPSQSLRRHVSRTLLLHRGRGLAGVVVQTLFSVALEILERAGRRVVAADAVFAILVRQAAEREAVLRSELGALRDGYAPVAASVADLLDAGFVAPHAEMLDELLAAQAGAGAVVERARAVVRVAEATHATLQRLDLARSSTLLQEATDHLLQEGARVLPAAGVFVHGFADATGAATDLLEALCRALSAEVFFDLPPEPGTTVPTADSSHGQRLRERLGFLAGDGAVSSSTPTQLHLLDAPGAQAEARSVVQQVARRIAAGVAPESIAIVARDLSAYTAALRTHCGRLGVPFSGISALAPIAASGRRLRALLDLLRRRHNVTTEGWLDAAAGVGERLPLDDTQRVELRVGLRACGAGRLRDVARLDASSLLGGSEDLTLPLGRGLRAPAFEDEGEADAFVAETAGATSRRSLAGRVLGDAIGCAQAMERLWQHWPAAADLAAHLAQLQSLSRHLGWPDLEAQLPGLGELARRIPESLVLDYDDFVALLVRATEAAVAGPVGGAGGGVQILSVMEARSRCWEHLFVLGMNRDVFPRTVREDPLLPDWLRQNMAGVLADIPIKSRGFDEERFLFAQLLASSPSVTLSWQTADDDGKVMTPSPLVERLRLTHRDLQVEHALPVFTRPATPPAPAPKSPRRRRDRSQLALAFAEAPAQPADPRPAFEHAVVAGAYGSRPTFVATLPMAVAEAQERFAAPSPITALASAARAAILAEIDPDLRSADGRQRRQKLGPYLGLIGPCRLSADRRQSRLFITTIERFAGCPWQTFVRRVLAIEPPPDPLSALPDLDNLLIGSAVHAALEAVVRVSAPARGGTRRPRPAPWPEEPELTTIIAAAARSTLREAGVALPGLARVLAQRVRPYLDAAKQADWVSAPPVVAQIESEDALTVADRAGQSHLIHFRADRVDRVDETLRFTDYKSGRPFTKAKREEVRRGHVLAGVSRGELLQAVAYAHSAASLQAGIERATGRYLYLHPDAADEHRVIEISSEDEEAEARMRHTIAVVLQAWQEGSFFPRLIDVETGAEPAACERCEVATACVRGDSGVRRRLHDWLDAPAHSSAAAAEVAAREAWDLRRKPPPEGAA